MGSAPSWRLTLTLTQLGPSECMGKEVLEGGGALRKREVTPTGKIRKVPGGDGI